VQKKRLISSMKTTEKTGVATALLTVMLIGCPLLRAQAPHREVRLQHPRPERCENQGPEPRDDSQRDLNSRKEYEKPAHDEGGAGLVALVVVLVVCIGICGLFAALTGLGKWLFGNWAPQK